MRRILLWPALVMTLVFFVAPFLMLGAVSLRARYPGAGGWTATHYWKFLADPYYYKIMANTLKLGLLTTVITLLLAYPVAYFLVRTTSRWHQVVFIALISPLLVSTVVRSFGWVIILGREGVINSLLRHFGLIGDSLPLMYNMGGTVVALVHVLFPFMVLSLTAGLGAAKPSMEEAAAILGATRLTTFLRVILPLSMPGIAAGCSVVFALAVGAYVTPALIGGGKVVVMATYIYDQVIVSFNWPFGAAISVIVLGAILVLTTAWSSLLQRLFNVHHL